MKLAATILFVGSSPVLANGAEEALLAQVGDVEYGQFLAGECTTCHQVSGAMDGIPSIVGWDETAFRLAMRDYRAATREHPVMTMIAARLGDEEIAALSAYFGSLQPE